MTTRLREQTEATTLADADLLWASVKGAAVATDGAITATDRTLTSASNPFSASDVNRTIIVEGAGSGGTDLVAIVASFTGAGEVELDRDAETTASGADIFLLSSKRVASSKVRDLAEFPIASAAINIRSASGQDINLEPQGAGHVCIQPGTNTTTTFQVLTSGGNGVITADTTNERVGIGIAAPTQKLHVQGSSGTTTHLVKDTKTTAATVRTCDVILDADNAGARVRLVATKNASEVVSGWVGTVTSGADFAIRSGNSARITVAGSTGYVGLQGVASPAAFLHCPASTTAAASIRIPSGTAPSSPGVGDFWYDGTNLKFRESGVTRTLTWL